MNGKYIISADQSTQGTKALLFDDAGRLLLRRDRAHRQIINERGWVSHDGEEIYKNTVAVLQELITESGIEKEKIATFGISNQRETSLAWHRKTGKPLDYAIVWQCSRGAEICRQLKAHEETVREKTGIPLSPYFPAAKFAWLLQNADRVKEALAAGELCLGTVDSYLIYRLTGGVYKTDYSNASRTQLFDLRACRFDEELCRIFGIPEECLPAVEDSDGDFGSTDLEGFLEKPVPIRGVLGDSHAALFGQRCLKKGMIKTTYGTGSSIMMNVGEQPVFGKTGVVSSVGFKVGGRISYVLEGNLNYTGAVISWLKNDLKLIERDSETETLAYSAHPEDTTYIVPAFTGLGAPYWDSSAKAAILGMSRTTGRAEIVKAALSCIAHQITDIVEAMQEDSGIRVEELRVDGGPTRNKFLMQLQSNLAGCSVQVPDTEELSGTGAAFAAGMAAGLYTEEVFEAIHRTAYRADMDRTEKERLRSGWKEAVGKVLTRETF